MSVNFPPCPESLKSIQPFLKTASEHDSRDLVVSYWCRLYALQVGLKLTSNKTPEETALLLSLMDWLEVNKKENADNEAITNEVAAQAHLENYALKLFLYADKQDRAANFSKNVVKAFYTAGVVFDVLNVFGELTEEVAQNKKYAKWKAAYIHTCLKNGEVPLAGPAASENENEGLESGSSNPPSNPDPTALPSTNTVQEENDVNEENVFKPFENTIQEQNSEAEQNENAKLSPDQVTKAQKYCKWASSALSYDDINTAIMNLRKALKLLETGKDEE